MRDTLFRLYWFDLRTGLGHPAKDYPDPVVWEQARTAVRDRVGLVRHPVHSFLELHYEPVDLFEKHTSKNEAR